MRVSSPDFLQACISHFKYCTGFLQIPPVQQPAKKKKISPNRGNISYMNRRKYNKFFRLSRKTTGELLSYEHPLRKEPVLFKKDGGGCLEINNRHVLIPSSALTIYESRNHGY